MLFVYVLLGLLGLLLLLILLILFVPIGVRLMYDGELHVRVRVLGVPLTILPAEEKPDKLQQPKRKKKASGKTSELKSTITASFRQDGVGATLHYLGELAGIAGKAVGKLLRAVVVDRLHLDLLIATDDPQDTAVRYGQVCGVLYPALAVIERMITVRRRELRVEPNFLRESSAAYIDMKAHVWVYRVVGAGVSLLVQYLILQIKTTDNKGGL